MSALNQLLLVLHFLGLAVGMSASVVGLVMNGLMTSAAPAERPVLARVPAVMSHVGGGGLLVLWATGLMLVFTKWGGFANLPWQFHVKIAAVVLMTMAVGMAHALQAKVKRGETAAAARLPLVGQLILGLSIVAIAFAVLTFD